MRNASRLLLFLAILVTPSGVMAQSNPVTTSLKGLYGITATNILATANQLDEALYAYRPTDDVRTAGQLLTHIANAQYLFCAAAVGENSPLEENLEETKTTKASIVPALQAAVNYCNAVYDRMTDADGAVMHPFFGNDMAASAILAFNSAHNYEHYGNLVTYMRINGMVPPSSQQ